jgi:hypothetical protein
MVGLIEGLAEDWRRLDGRARQIKFFNARLGRKPFLKGASSTE